jgi:hypothetical protein
MRPHLDEWLGAEAYTWCSKLLGRLRSGRLWFQASPGKKKFLRLNLNRKKLGVVAYAWWETMPGSQFRLA